MKMIKDYLPRRPQNPATVDLPQLSITSDTPGAQIPAMEVHVHPLQLQLLVAKASSSAVIMGPLLSTYVSEESVG